MSISFNGSLAVICTMFAALLVPPTPVADAQETAGQPAAAPAAAGPIAVLAISSYDELMQDVDFLGGLIGQNQLSQVAEQMLQGAPGLDRTRPMGLVVQRAGLPPSFGFCLPVTDFNALLAALQPMGLTAQDAGNGVTQLTVMNYSAFAKEAGGWALISMAPVMLDGLPADPAAEFAKLTADYDLGIRINVQNVPEAEKQQLLDVMSMSARMGMAQKENETSEQFAARQSALDAQLADRQRLFRQLDQITVGLSIDRAEQRLLLDFGGAAIPGSELAQELAADSAATTNLAGFQPQDAAIVASISSKLTGVDGTKIEQIAAAVREKINESVAGELELSEAGREKMRSAVSDFVDALSATLQTGVLDGAGAVRVSPEALTIVAAGAVGDPAKVEAGLRKLAEVAAEEKLEMPEIKWNAESYQDIQFHVMSKPTPEGDLNKALLGDELQIAVGIGPGQVYFGWGKNWLDEMKKAIDASAANPGQATLPVQLLVSATPIVDTVVTHAEEDQRAIAGAMQGALGQAPGRDRLTLVYGPVENGVRMRLEVQDGLLRAVGAGSLTAKMQQAQSPQEAGIEQPSVESGELAPVGAGEEEDEF